MFGGVHYGFARQRAYVCVYIVEVVKAPADCLVAAAQVSFKVLIKSHVAFCVFFFISQAHLPFCKVVNFIYSTCLVN